MKTNSTQQEILLVTGTSFSSREANEINESSGNDFTEKEKLVAACWNGLLPEILPEVFKLNSTKEKLYLREIREASSFIELELGESNREMEKHLSIDPYSFLSVQKFS